jgi:tetratricopeptide (TPR) repeat protein
VQENILNNIVSTIVGRIENMELRLANQKETENLSAYDFVLRGYAQFPKWTKESFESARENFRDAIELDPHYARAYAGIGFTHNIDFSRGWGENPQLSLEKARELSLKAIELDDKDNRPRVVLGWAYINAGELDKGIAEIKKGISLNPNDANVLARSGYALTYYGEFQQAIDQVKRAMRINPFHPSYYYDVLAWAQYFLKQYSEALKTLENVPEPNSSHLLTLAAVNARIGDLDKAQAYVQKIQKINPDFNLDKYREARPFKHPEHIDFHVESLRMAGLP